MIRRRAPAPPAPPTPRFFGGPRALAALLPRLTRPAFRKRSPAGALLMADWQAAVGPALAAATAPQRLNSGTLTIACAGPVAMELAHRAPQLIGRLNAHMGRVAVDRLRFVQTGAAPAASPPAAVAAALPKPVAAAVAPVTDPGLRAALEKLGQGVYRERGRSAPR